MANIMSDMMAQEVMIFTDWYFRVVNKQSQLVNVRVLA